MLLKQLRRGTLCFFTRSRKVISANLNLSSDSLNMITKYDQIIRSSDNFWNRSLSAFCHHTIISVLSLCGETAHFETLAAMGMLTRRERCGQ